MQDVSDVYCGNCWSVNFLSPNQLDQSTQVHKDTY